MKKLFAILVIVMSISALLISGCGGKSDYAAAAGDTVSVYYTGTLEKDGSEFDSNVGSGIPLTFEVGAKQMIPGFDAAVVGMKVGDTKTVTLPPEEAYGYWTKDLVFTMNIDQFGGYDIAVGDKVPLQTREGMPFTVLITAIDGDIVTVDANFDLAGETLVFEIMMDSITPAK